MNWSYIVVQSTSKVEFQRKVRTHLNFGAILHGPMQVIVVVGDKRPIKYFQAMVYKPERQE